MPPADGYFCNNTFLEEVFLYQLKKKKKKNRRSFDGKFHLPILNFINQLIFTCLKLTIEILEQCAKYVQS